jgi:cobalt-zinc-cadmium efflux system outer membrane protein
LNCGAHKGAAQRLFEMNRLRSGWFISVSIAAPLCLTLAALGQGPRTPFTWQEIKDKFEAVNPTLIAARANIDESRMLEITAYLRPNPSFSLSADGLQLTPNDGIYRPVSGIVFTPAISYLHERQHKRELRLETAKDATAVAESSYSDQARGLLFNLRNAFVLVLQAKAFLSNANENLVYWDRELGINRNRYNAGDLDQLDLHKLELQRIQFETDFQTATLNLRTSKIQIQQLILDRTPMEAFDVAGPYDFTDSLRPLEEFRTMALDARPDLKVAIQNIELAKANHKLAISNGSVDPTFSLWYSRNASFANPYANNTVGGSVGFDLRIFDRNQGEKARTQMVISQNEHLKDAAEAQVFNDVDTAYVTIEQAVNLLGRYKSFYLPLAADVRDKTRDAFQHGGATLLDYLDAEKGYRDANLAFLNFIGSYLTAAAQMNMAVGREVIP